MVLDPDRPHQTRQPLVAGGVSPFVSGVLALLTSKSWDEPARIRSRKEVRAERGGEQSLLVLNDSASSRARGPVPSVAAHQGNIF
jgi:hypothetical protein